MYETMTERAALDGRDTQRTDVTKDTEGRSPYIYGVKQQKPHGDAV